MLVLKRNLYFETFAAIVRISKSRQCHIKFGKYHPKQVWGLQFFFAKCKDFASSFKISHPRQTGQVSTPTLVTSGDLF